MIIKLKGADFSSVNINNLLNSWLISIKNGNCVTAANNISSVEKNQQYSNTFTIKENYEVTGVVVTMGGQTLENVVTTEGSTITINITTVTAAVSIEFSYNYNGGTVEPDEPVISYISLPTTKYALGVTSTGTGRVSANNAKRFSTADDNTANGILIPAGKTLHLVGLASGTYPLRLDYIYCTNNVKCPVSGSTTSIEGLVGTASNYVSANYFPLNTEGNDTIDITNNYGSDYYFWFGFAGLTLNEGILAEYDTYDLKYYIA